MLLISLLLLLTPFASFAVMRLFERTGHSGAIVLVASGIFVLSVLSSFAVAGGFAWTFFGQSLVFGLLTLWAILVLIGCVIMTTGLAFALCVKDWPVRNLD